MSKEKKNGSSRRARDRKSEPKPARCKTPGCQNQPAPDSRFCPLCDITVKFHRQVDKANRRGDTLGALVNTGLAFLFNGIREGRVAAPLMDHPFEFTQQPAPVPPPKPSPFVVLGLDPKVATEKDVRRIQRGAAEMWHADKGGGLEGQARLAEINAAAEACLRAIRSKSS